MERIDSLFNYVFREVTSTATPTFQPEPSHLQPPSQPLFTSTPAPGYAALFHRTLFIPMNLSARRFGILTAMPSWFGTFHFRDSSSQLEQRHFEISNRLTSISLRVFYITWFAKVPERLSQDLFTNVSFALWTKFFKNSEALQRDATIAFINSKICNKSGNVCRRYKIFIANVRLQSVKN